MAITRLTLANLETAILEATGYSSSALAPWGSSATLYTRINQYGTQLPMKLNMVARELGLPVPIYFGMWKSAATSATTGTGLKIAASSSTAYMPTDYDHYISFYDLTNKRPIHVIEEADEYLVDELVTMPAGPPKRIQLHGFALDGSDWRMSGTIYPSTLSGVTPSVRLRYYRIPAAMAGASPSAEYPDVDPKYQDIFWIGPVVELTASTDPETHDKHAAMEHSMLVNMCQTAGNI